MKLSQEWFSTIGENDKGVSLFISGRDDIEGFKTSGKFPERVEIYWKYEGDNNKMPLPEEAEKMEKMQEALQSALEKNKLAILTGVYTGDNERTFVFYTRTSTVFGQTLNEALKEHPLYPIEVYVEKDPQWNEYQEMYQIKVFAD